MGTKREAAAYAKGYEDGKRDAELRMTERIDAAMRLAHPDHITPIGVRIITLAMHKSDDD